MESERSIDQSRSLFVVMLFTASTSLAAMGKITFDVTLVGRLGNTELAAFAFVFPVIFIVTSMGQGIYIATAASFTRGINILDHRVALRPMLYAFAVSLFLGILIAIALRAILPDVLAMLGAISHLDQLNRYFSIWLWTVPLIFVSANTFALIRNLGYLKIASAITLIATLVGVAFSPMLILEGQRGIVGSAYSTLITSLFSTFISLLFVLLRSVYSHAHLARTAVLDLARRIMAIALPVLLSNVLLFIFMSFATSVFSGLGEGAVAAYGITGRIEQILFVFQSAYVTVAIPTLTQQFVSNDLADTRRFARSIVLSMLGLACVLGSVSLGFREQIANLIAPPGEARIICFFYLAFMPFTAGFQGLFLLSTTMLNLRGKAVKALLWYFFYFGVSASVLYFAAGYGVQSALAVVAGCNVVAGSVAWLLVRNEALKVPRRAHGRELAEPLIDSLADSPERRRQLLELET